MRYVTIAQLREKQHSLVDISDYDLERVNTMVARLEEARNILKAPCPIDGDLVTCFSTIKGKVVSEYARLQHETSHETGDPLVNVTVHDASVHILSANEHIAIGAGGPEYKYPLFDFIHQAEYLGRCEATFWIWNRWGAGPNHGISFQASVHRWKLTEDHLFN